MGYNVEELKFASYFPASLIALYLIVQYIGSLRRRIDLPSVGPSGVVSSYYGAFKFLFWAKEMLQEGYIKAHQTGAFKLPRPGQWQVIVAAPDLVEEVKKAPEDVLSFTHATFDIVATQWTLGLPITDSGYQIPIIRGQFTRNVGMFLDDIQDEIVHALNDSISLNENEWTKVSAYSTMANIVARASNRVFVGLPLCRNPKYLELSIGFATDVISGALILNMFPKCLRPIVGRVMTRTRRSIQKGVGFLQPVIEERFRKIEEYGKDYPGKPLDLLSLLIDSAVGEHRTVKDLTIRVLGVNVAAIHTSTSTLTHALLHLAAEPEKYLPAMREEVERVVKEDGWTKASITKMRKLDSFLKETLRFTGVEASSMRRKTLKPYALPNGTLIPPGTIVSVATRAIHHDESNYPKAEIFDGFRFADTQDGEEGAKHQMVATATNFLAFGLGKHACPGRFFAATELKAILAHIVLNYDIRTVVPGVRPPDMCISEVILPNMKAEVLFRRRQT